MSTIHEWQNTASDFASDDYIGVDGENLGSRKMSKDSLLRLTSQHSIENIVPEFSSANTYAVGTLVTKDGTLYKCTTAHSGNWNSQHFTEATVNDEFVRQLSIASEFASNVATVKNKLYWYNNNLYICNVAYTGAWNSANFTAVTLGDLVTLYGLAAATEEDLVAGSKIPIMTATGSKSLPGNAIAKASDFSTLAAKRNYSDCAANAVLGSFSTASGGSVVIAYKRLATGVDYQGFLLVTKAANIRVTAVIVSNYPDNCPLSVIFDGTRCIVKNNTSSEVAYSILSLSTVFSEGSSLPSGWDSSTAQEISPSKIGPVDLTSFATKSYVDDAVTNSKQAVSLAGYAYFGSFPTAAGGGIIISYRRAGYASGMLIIGKYSTFNSLIHIGDGSACPLEVIFDGTRLVVKNKVGTVVDVNLVVTSGSFVTSSELPAGWNSQSAVTLVPVEIKPVNTSDFVTKATASNCSWVLANKLVGYAPSASGGGLFIAYRYAGGAYGTATGYTLISRTAGVVQAVNISERSNSWPFRLLWDGTRFAVQNKLSIGVDVKVLGKWSTFVEDSEFPSNWNSANQVEVGSNVIQINPVETPSSYTANRNQTKYLNAITRYRKAGNTARDFCAMLVSDSHGDWQSVTNARVCADSFPQIDLLIHCGDAAGDSLTRGTTSIQQWSDIVSSATKPLLFVDGNHEAGNYKNLSLTPSKSDLYSCFIAPIVSKGFLSVGTYTENKLYYYKDFATRKVRVIVIDEYEAPQDIDASKWTPVTYNSEYPTIANNTDYSAGDKVNVAGYTDYSFEAVASINSGTYYSGNQPSFKIRSGYRYISQTQAQWLCTTLASVPDGYSVLLCTHQVFSTSCAKVESKFTQTDWPSEPSAQSVMSVDLLGKIVKNFIAKTSESVTVAGMSDASYLDDYTLLIDFTGYTGTVKNLCFVCGHHHKDFLLKNEDDIYQVAVTTSNTTSYANYSESDIERCPSSDFVACDCLTCVAVRDTGETGLCKIGNNLTYYGTLRDFEIVATLS